MKNKALRIYFGIGITCLTIFIVYILRHFIYESVPYYSIGIYNSISPFIINDDHKIHNPVLSSDMVTDIEAAFVADPFIVIENNKYYLFFEVMRRNLKSSAIGYAMSNDGIKWNYKNIILNENSFISYPCIFKYHDKYYMIPETSRMEEIRLYEALEFPAKWRYKKTLIKGKPFSDSSIIFYNNLWWIFTSTNKNRDLELYYSKDLLSEWYQHKKNPVLKNSPHYSRPAGNLIIYGDKIIRYAQDDKPNYGNKVWTFLIYRLDTNEYDEKIIGKDPIIGKSGNGWNKDGMHTLNIVNIGKNKWIVCVDGYRQSRVLKGCLKYVYNIVIMLRNYTNIIN